jgi:hypothetical protein
MSINGQGRQQCIHYVTLPYYAGPVTCYGGTKPGGNAMRWRLPPWTQLSRRHLWHLPPKHTAMRERAHTEGIIPTPGVDEAVFAELFIVSAHQSPAQNSCSGKLHLE